MKARKKTSPQTNSQSNELDVFLTALVGKLPKATVGQKFGHVNFTVGKKVFAFTRPDGVAMKLPLPTVDSLVLQKKAARLIMGKKVMKEWVLLKHPKPADYKADLNLFKESLAFVSANK